MTLAQVLLNSTEEIFCTVNRLGEIIEANQPWHDFIGNSRLTSLVDLFRGETGAELSRLLAIDSTKRSTLSECKIVHPDGRIFWMNLKVQMIAPGRSLIVMKDVTEFKNLSGILSSIVEPKKLGHFCFDSDTGRLHWSHELYEMFDRDPQTFTPDLSFLIFAFGDKNVDHMTNLLQGPLSRKIDTVVPFQRKRSEEIWLNIRANKKYSSPTSFTIQGIIQDVTKERHKEILQLSQNVELTSYEKGLEKFCIVARTDPYGKIIYANEQFCKISKYSHDELIGKDHRMLNSGHHPKSFFKEMWSCILSGQSWRGEIKNRAKDGSYYWVDTIIIPICDSEGKLLEVFSFRYEMTHIKEMELENIILKNKLELLVTKQEDYLLEFSFQTGRLLVDYRLLEMIDPNQSEPMTIYHFLSFLPDIDAADIDRFFGDKAQAYFQRASDFVSPQEVFLGFLRFKVVRDENGNPIHMDGILKLVKK